MVISFCVLAVLGLADETVTHACCQHGQPGPPDVQTSLWLSGLLGDARGYRRSVRLFLFTRYFTAPEDDRAPFCVRRPRIDALHVGVRGVFRRRQAKGNGAPGVFEDRRIMEERRERVGTKCVAFCHYDSGPVNDDAVPDGMHWARPSYLVHRNF